MGSQAATKQHIWQSFSTLIRTTPFDKITVEMIIRESKVSKSTFYRHFRDKYDVLNYNSMEIADQQKGLSRLERILRQYVSGNPAEPVLFSEGFPFFRPELSFWISVLLFIQYRRGVLSAVYRHSVPFHS